MTSRCSPRETGRANIGKTGAQNPVTQALAQTKDGLGKHVAEASAGETNEVGRPHNTGNLDRWIEKGKEFNRAFGNPVFLGIKMTECDGQKRGYDHIGGTCSSFDAAGNLCANWASQSDR
jgi:hypothetical protein